MLSNSLILETLFKKNLQYALNNIPTTTHYNPSVDTLQLDYPILTKEDINDHNSGKCSQLSP